MNPLDEPDVTGSILRALDGDGEAWLALVAGHGGRLRRYAEARLDGRLRGRIDPDDVVQEALIEAFRTLGRFFDTPLAFSAWLRQRVRDRLHNLHREHLDAGVRTARREADAGPGWGDRLVDPGTSPSGRAARGDDARMLNGTFDRLAEGDREILRMYFHERMPHAEIAATFGIEPAAVRKRLSRAVARLGDRLWNAHPEWCHAHTSPDRRRAIRR